MPPTPHALLLSSSPPTSSPLTILFPLSNNNNFYSRPQYIPFSPLRTRTKSLPIRYKCSPVSVSVSSSPTPMTELDLSAAEASAAAAAVAGGKKPSPAEDARTIMELSSAGTLSTVAHDGWPLALGVQFVTDDLGIPALCLPAPAARLLAYPSDAPKVTFHVHLEQSGSRTCHTTLLGTLEKPAHDEDGSLYKKLSAKWEKKFGEELDKDSVYLISVENVLHMEDFKEEGIWVISSDYFNAEPDPLRNFAEKIVDEMNSKHIEDVQRLCHIFVDSGLQVTDARMIWVDRLGFDLYLYSEKGVFAARIPFPLEVTDEKGVKSSFNSMSHLAWEVEKNYIVPGFEKVKCLKKIR